MAGCRPDRGWNPRPSFERGMMITKIILAVVLGFIVGFIVGCKACWRHLDKCGIRGFVEIKGKLYKLKKVEEI